MLRETGIVLFVCAMASMTAAAESPPDALRGQAYSQAICASCHSVAAENLNSPNPAAKPFAKIAIAYPTAEAFAKWLNTEHPLVPNNLIKPAQADDIMLYIASMKSPAGR